MKRKWYVGIVKDHYEAFHATEKPEPGDYIYHAVIGPFVTKRAAIWAEKHGYNNPHFQHVRDAERISKL